MDGLKMVTQKDIEALSPMNLRKMGFNLPELTKEQMQILENVKPPEHIRAGRCWIMDLRDKEEL